jgi:hypothetical protein
LKARESEAYQKELNNSKLENQKLKEKIKTFMRNAAEQDELNQNEEHKNRPSEREISVLKDQITQLIRENHKLKN